MLRSNAGKRFSFDIFALSRRKSETTRTVPVFFAIRPSRYISPTRLNQITVVFPFGRSPCGWPVLGMGVRGTVLPQGVILYFLVQYRNLPGYHRINVWRIRAILVILSVRLLLVTSIRLMREVASVVRTPSFKFNMTSWACSLRKFLPMLTRASWTKCRWRVRLGDPVR